VKYDLRCKLQAQRERLAGSLPAARSRFFARSRPPGPAFAITSRANAAAPADTDDGRHRPI
jgi:hypothetical protein